MNKLASGMACDASRSGGVGSSLGLPTFKLGKDGGGVLRTLHKFNVEVREIMHGSVPFALQK